MEKVKEVKKATEKVSEKVDSGFYKGYDMRWLRKETEHPDFHLVAEYDKKV